MKRFSTAILLACLLVGGAEARVFTDPQGRKLEGELIAMTPAGHAVLQTARGEVVVPLQYLSETDKEYVKAWQAANPGRLRCNLRFQVYRDEVDQERAKDMGHVYVDYDEKLKTTPRRTSLSIYNKGAGAIPDLKCVIHVFVEDLVDVDAGDYRKYSVGTRATRGPIKQYRGEILVDSIRPGGRVDIDYTYDLHYYVDRDGGRVDESAKDRYLGFWIRTYLGESLVDEYKKQMDRRMRLAVWDDKTAFKLSSIEHEVK